MSKINTGGRAFPSNYTLSDEAIFIYKGMTMRDYFAAKAMQATLSRDFNSEWESSRLSKWAYVVADAMLAERERGE